MDWICVFIPDRNRSENNTCYILDTLSRGKITKNVENKVCALLLCKEPVIKVAINLVQQQGNGADCFKYYFAGDSGFKIQVSKRKVWKWISKK